MDTHLERRRQDEMNTIAEQAAGWLLELQTAGPREPEAFLKWIAESPLHVEAFLQASTMDKLLENVDPEREIGIEPTPVPSTPTNVVTLAARVPDVNVPESGFRFRWRWAIAAMVVAVIAGGWWLAPTWSGWQNYSTDIGEQRSVQLSDGSMVHINTGSRIAVHLSPHSREVRLLAGEALFNVRHDPSRPFRVHSTGAVVQAVGTQFNVYRHTASTTVSVLEGRVRISAEPKGEIAKEAMPAARMLAAGEQANVAPNGKVVKRARMDVVRVTAWRQRQLVFVNDTLADIAAEFNRYNETPQIHVQDEAARARRYAGGFDANDPESLALFLAKDPTLEVEKDAGVLRIRSR